MAKLLQANDALTNAIDVNNGFEALIELMRSAREADAPSLTHLSDLLWSIQKDMAVTLDYIKALHQGLTNEKRPGIPGLFT